MNPTLNFDDFFDKEGIFQRDQIAKSSVIELLGDSLKATISELLDRLEVNSQPLILGDCAEGAYVSGRVYIAEGATVEPTAMIQGPSIIGPGTQVRHGAYIRGNVFAGAKCVIGHATEVKGSVFLDGAKAGHFAYVGDSVLGRDVNLGAGTKIANLKLANNEVSYEDPNTGELYKSGLRKFGAILGDRAQTGCNAVVSPGSLLLPGTMVMSCHHFVGTLKKGIAR